MTAQTNLRILLKTLNPTLNNGEFVFCSANNFHSDHLNEVIMTFRETEGITIIIRKETADENGWPYSFVAAWITLTVHSSLEAVGLTAAFSAALAAEGISCNVVAAVHHDHIFVALRDAAKAMNVLRDLSTK
jgi:hypothetical protein